MAPTRVGVIGGGVAGPVMAIFLKSKGYEPIVFERRSTFDEGGLATGYVTIVTIVNLLTRYTSGQYSAQRHRRALQDTRAGQPHTGLRTRGVAHVLFGPRGQVLHRYHASPTATRRA